MTNAALGLTSASQIAIGSVNSSSAAQSSSNLTTNLTVSNPGKVNATNLSLPSYTPITSVQTSVPTPVSVIAASNYTTSLTVASPTVTNTTLSNSNLLQTVITPSMAAVAGLSQATLDQLQQQALIQAQGLTQAITIEPLEAGQTNGISSAGLAHIMENQQSTVATNGITGTTG